MKKTNLFVASLVMLLMVASCSQDEMSETPSSIEVESALPKSTQDFNVPNELDSQHVYTLEELDDLIQQQFEEEYKGYTKIENVNDYLKNKTTTSDTDIKNSEKALPVPLSVQAIKTKLQENYRIILTNQEGGLATGTYFCDLYVHKAEVNLPPNTLGLAYVPNPVGYSSLSPQAKRNKSIS